MNPLRKIPHSLRKAVHAESTINQILGLIVCVWPIIITGLAAIVALGISMEPGTGGVWNKVTFVINGLYVMLTVLFAFEFLAEGGEDEA